MSEIILHPDYAELVPDYTLMRVAFAGQRKIKEETTTYLKATSGMIEDGYPSGVGRKAYDAYIDRAIYYPFVKEAIQSLLGTMYSKSPTFNLPSGLKYLEGTATSEKEPLSLLLQRINKEQLNVGRIGLLVDAPKTSGLPYIAKYRAETILDWDISYGSGYAELTYLCLDESGPIRTSDGKWENTNSYRLLRIIDGIYQVAVVADIGDEPEWEVPTANGKPLTVIPFTFINLVDLSTTPDVPPLLFVANMSVSIYKQSADQKQGIFHSAQATTVRVGAEPETKEDGKGNRLGAGALVDVPMGGDLKYMETSGAGLAEMRLAIDSDKAQVSVFSSSFAQDLGANASGNSIRLRLEAINSVLKNIATTGAYGLERALEHCSLFVGSNSVATVTPNLDFSSEQLLASELKILIEAKVAGAPITDKQIHSHLVDKGWTNLSFEEVLKELELETKTPNLHEQNTEA